MANKQPDVGKKRRLDWAKYTDFRSRHSRQDLASLCSKSSKSHLRVVFRTPDKTGLLPIHWAAIHNRSDLIDLMLDYESPLRVRCKNKLFADGSALHLASMNGSIQAAATLLRRSSQTRPKSQVPDESRSGQDDVDDEIRTEWLKERDSEGQTALMRAAPPRSKRLDLVRELLRKNFWSLGGRPAEMALFLINKGADWREVDSIYGMNLLHLAIANDYDDVVNLLLVIDKQLLKVPIQLGTSEATLRTMKEQEEELEERTPSSPVSNSSPSDSSTRSSISAPLISKDERAKDLLEKGVSPLQLAILYGRVSIIRLLWEETNRLQFDDTAKSGSKRRRMINESRLNEKRRELNSIILRAFWTNRTELSSTIKRVTLMLALAIDLALIILLWMPYFMSVNYGIFIISFCMTLALAVRVALMNPGYLARNTQEYLKEVTLLSNNSNNNNNGFRENMGSVNEPQQQQQQQLVDSSVIEMMNYDVEERVRYLCHRCRCIRRLRSRHCNRCKRCIRDFDHHCIYLNCCVGYKNRVEFFALILLMTITATYGYIITFEPRDYWLYQVGLFVSIFKYAIIGLFSAFCILKRASQGVTMYEEIRSRRIRNIFGPKGTPEEISETHKIYSTTQKGSFWRYTPNRFLTGDLSFKQIQSNLREFFGSSIPFSF